MLPPGGTTLCMHFVFSPCFFRSEVACLKNMDRKCIHSVLIQQKIWKNYSIFYQIPDLCQQNYGSDPPPEGILDIWNYDFSSTWRANHKIIFKMGVFCLFLMYVADWKWVMLSTCKGVERCSLTNEEQYSINWRLEYLLHYVCVVFFIAILPL